MAMIDKLWLATLTRNDDDAGTPELTLNVTINIDGRDVLDWDFGFLGGSGVLSGGLGPESGWLERGQAAIAGGKYGDPGETLPDPIETNLLTNSSIRLGIRDDQAWGPEHVLLFGQTSDAHRPRIVALAMETELASWISTDRSDGDPAKLTMPIRLVGSGSPTTLIRKALLLVYTEQGSATNDRIRLEVTAAGTPVVDQPIPDTPQDDLEHYTANWYPVDVKTPFTKGDVISNGSIRLSIDGDDTWWPAQVYVFGLDTETGRPNEVVTLVAIPQWNLGGLSTNTSQGQMSVLLPVSN
jgi:hypothetical protein